ncbi:YbjN domain-containing protein [Pseudanabaena sp. FACHB-2040]|uniref:T3SS (YopN, CesT) and YbjN peptide-binding chaperone 1 n=1 Tax=Pseudanabaena sp. FACHB-2040 TaxID=2692859 RepID=UPI001684DF0A|nr:YbjN domain-containing protein [Pseudanabaena sp. FACHB-2040]MBD0267059.1 YbjN domain-containing protein [Cyanobacteria bacterium Co-bin8]MBD2260889.1 YbjN domain-containing protein [Pseudanabaena sp. FACHB-2040]
MEFKTPAQKEIYERISPWMNELFSESVITFEDEPLFIVNFGSAVASTRVVPWGEDEALITTRSYVVTDLEVTPDLTFFLLRENNGIYFGRFALDDENDIVFEHSLVGSACNLIELKHSVMTVIRIADDYDDEIVTRWGGKRALDRWSS